MCVDLKQDHLPTLWIVLSLQAHSYVPVRKYVIYNIRIKVEK